ncbi:adenosylcobinamide kinase/adenosylcobinamide phosphate guanyltransferase [Geothrix limicola]|uniref:Adenosylcobinamide kinase n=1 Tax=Geothrix limicola TaxID=2927978 RepID=A0ABQ5QFL4_9BACT|nr:bifunctional adenosylcobinamide kinase/adenosylcobinamide-phosphate guanylyltransferase [Geothrix limicola]GLH73478.1 adenosylcobinamide kinase/adenosylcobinamide phosphate guanyltransferase [Geothrix limicola]
MAEIIYVTGPVRSGKSRYAVERASAWGPGVVFAATYLADPRDAEMTERVRRHKEERPADWRTLEAPEDVAGALRGLQPPPSGLLLDCQTLWLSARLDRSDEALLREWQELLDALREAPYPALLVGNEVGWSPVPESAELRRWRDLAGWMGQRSAAAAAEVWLLVAGCPLRLK